jgi:hypothetical protein
MRIAVETRIAARPRTEPYERNSRIRLPPRARYRDWLTEATSCSTSAVCAGSARSMTPDALDACATRVRRKITAGASFHDDDPPWPRNDGKAGLASQAR